jgi:Polyphosphate kinase 2 (PPK2)
VTNGDAPIAKSTISSSCWSTRECAWSSCSCISRPTSRYAASGIGCSTSLKRWKLTYDDFRNHASRSDYEAAIEDMLANTSTTHAPWYLIPANNKPFGRIAAFRIISDRLGGDVSLEPRPIHPELLEQAKQVLGLSASDIERASEPISPRARPRRYGPKTGRETRNLFPPPSKRK